MSIKPSFRFASLGSGSSGNATLVASDTAALIIDCGFSLRETIARFDRLDFSLDHIAGILVTHEHGDHAKGVSALARHCGVPVYMSAGTCIAGGFSSLEGVRIISANEPFSAGGFGVLPVTVPHDAREPLQFVVSHAERKLGILTDLGSVSPAVLDSYSGCDGLFVEANHDEYMLAAGPYPPSLQRRVGGPWGHLNNQQTLHMLRNIDLSRVQHLVVGHISKKNNSLLKVQSALQEISNEIGEVYYACQDQGFAWLHLR